MSLLRNLARVRPESSLLLAVALFGACVETTGADNDGLLPSDGMGATPGGTASGGGTPGGTTGSVGGTTAGSVGGTTAGTAGGTTAGSAGGTTAGTAGGTTAGTVGGTSAGTVGGTTAGPGGGSVGGTVSFSGRATGCTSYGTAAADGSECAGYYCNISQTELVPALNPAGKCGNLSADRVCKGELTQSVAMCSTENSGVTASNRAKVESCVYAKNPTGYADISKDCMSCFLDAAQCASQHCLTICLIAGTSSASCDSCRMENGCNQGVPICADLPSPF